MDQDKPVSGISRRSLLKRIGAGTAIAWSAPILSSLRTPAFASHYPGHCDTPCPACLPNACQTTPFICACFPPVRPPDGPCVCTFPRFCADAGFCFDDSGCPAGQTCVFSCCPPGPGGEPGTCALPCSEGPVGPAATGPGSQAG